VCTGVLSWLIEEGAAHGTDVSGLPVAVASRYSDDEPGSPWTWTTYLAARASSEQRAALESIFTGSLGGKAIVLGRFTGFVRATLPFVAGGSSGMALRRLIPYSVASAVAWTTLFTVIGYATTEPIASPDATRHANRAAAPVRRRTPATASQSPAVNANGVAWTQPARRPQSPGSGAGAGFEVRRVVAGGRPSGGSATAVRARGGGPAGVG
jgi:hypothetical protein